MLLYTMWHVLTNPTADFLLKLQHGRHQFHLHMYITHTGQLNAVICGAQPKHRLHSL